MVNKVILVGNVGQDPEVKHLESGVTVANFTLATNESYKDKSGQKITQTEWHRIVLWRGLADVAEKYVKKGEMLYIEGRIRTRDWTDKDGNKKYTTEIFGDDLKMLGRKDSSSQGSSQDTFKSAENDSNNQDVSPEDDLPF